MSRIIPVCTTRAFARWKARPLLRALVLIGLFVWGGDKMRSGAFPSAHRYLRAHEIECWSGVSVLDLRYMFGHLAFIISSARGDLTEYNIDTHVGYLTYSEKPIMSSASLVPKRHACSGGECVTYVSPYETLCVYAYKDDIRVETRMEERVWRYALLGWVVYAVLFKHYSARRVVYVFGAVVYSIVYVFLTNLVVVAVLWVLMGMDSYGHENHPMLSILEHDTWMDGAVAPYGAVWNHLRIAYTLYRVYRDTRTKRLEIVRDIEKYNFIASSFICLVTIHSSIHIMFMGALLTLLLV